MLTSSPSPTLSAPSSPHAAFPSRLYHASYRNPSSKSPNSPRADSPRYTQGRRLTNSTPLQQPQTAPPTVPAVSQTPRYVNSATQYSPIGYPPTYRRASIRPPVTLPSAADPSKPAAAASAQRSPVEKRRESSAKETGTTAEPAESVPREAPQSSTPDQNAHKAPIPVAAPTGGGQATESDTNPEESPSKRPRPPTPVAKIMPLKYEDCDVKDLGILVSEMLMELVRINDLIPLKDGQLTRFHSRAPPAISVKDYLNRIIVHATISPPILLSMVYYVDRLCALYPPFTISSLTVHRFLIVAATVGSKGLSDSFWTNSVYARVGGVSTKELSLLEIEFLRRVEWRIVPKPEVLVDYYKGLVERGKGYTMEQGNDDTDGTDEVVTSDSSD